MAEPITVAELRSHLRLVHTDEDAYLGTLIQAAREVVEQYTNRCLVPKVITMRMDGFPADRRFIELPMPPSVSLTSIAYINTDGNTVSLASTSVDGSDVGKGEPAIVALEPDADWPDTEEDRPGSVTVAYLAGYANTTDVPAGLKTACLWIAAWWYEQRMPVNAGNIVNAAPEHFQAVLQQHRAELVFPNAFRSIVRADPAP